MSFEVYSVAEAEYLRGLVMGTFIVAPWEFEIPPDGELQDQFCDGFMHAVKERSFEDMLLLDDRHRCEELRLLGGQEAVDFCAVLNSDLAADNDRAIAEGRPITVADIKKSLVVSATSLAQPPFNRPYDPYQHTAVDPAEIDRIIRRLSRRS